MIPTCLTSQFTIPLPSYVGRGIMKTSLSRKPGLLRYVKDSRILVTPARTNLSDIDFFAELLISRQHDFYNFRPALPPPVSDLPLGVLVARTHCQHWRLPPSPSLLTQYVNGWTLPYAPLIPDPRRMAHRVFSAWEPLANAMDQNDILGLLLWLYHTISTQVERPRLLN